MRTTITMLALLSMLFAEAAYGQPVGAAVTHRQFQAVNDRGEQTYKASARVVLEGIVLNGPADLLDPTPDDTVTQLYNLAGQWQIFLQGCGEDHAGTAVWMGQLYNNLPWISPTGGYSNQEFVAELTRLNAAQFSPGDRIRVTGYFLSYQGRINVNEQHDKNPDHDFTIELIHRGAGLPRPDLVTLDKLKYDNDRFIFDPARQTGCEYYQGCLVKIEDVNFVDASKWGPNADLLITDGRKTFPLKLGRGNGIYLGSNNLKQPFDVIGILDQESTDLKAGYRLYVMDYDGNGRVLACREYRLADCPGDTNLDGTVDFVDFARLAEDWLEQ